MTKPDTPISLEKDTYEILDHLGEGAYGVVWRARRLSDGETVAIKIVQTCNPGNKAPYSTLILRKIISLLKWEIRFLQNIGEERARKQHILPLLDSGEHEGRPVMVMLLCDHSLNHVYVKRRDDNVFPFDGPLLLRWIGQMADALAGLHSAPQEEGIFIHRDLKFVNILMRDDDLWLCDFGTVKIIEHEFTTSLAGTLEWGAPEMFIPAEIINDKPQYELTPAADMYALGLVVHALITGNIPKAQAVIGNQTRANGKPLPGAEKYFGTIGGLGDQERTILQRDIRRLIAPGETLVQQEFLALPDTEAVIRGIARLTENLLAPRAEDRPSAQAVTGQAREMRDFLAPVLSGLEIQVPGKTALGKTCTVTVTAHGRGLPGHGKWLHSDVSGKRADAVIRKAGKDAWELTLPRFENTGEYDIRVFAFVNQEETEAREKVKVSATPDQLWARKLYAEALTLSPERTEWLDFLEKKAKRKSGRREYLGILEKIREAHKHRKPYPDIERRYWQQITLQEEEHKKPGKGIPLRWLAAFLMVILVAAAGAGIYKKFMGSRGKTPSVTTTTTVPVTSPIESLLAEAREQMEKKRLTNPEGDNAYETCQEILSADPGNEKASQMIRDIADRYSEWGESSLDKSRYDKALSYAESALKVIPGYPRALAVTEDAAAAYIRLGKDELAGGNIKDALAYREKIRELFAQYELTDETGEWQDFDQQLTAETDKTGKIASLVTRARNQVRKNRLTRPAGDNAYETCREIFALDSGNRDAGEVMEDIIARLVSKGLIEKALDILEASRELADRQPRTREMQGILRSVTEHYAALGRKASESGDAGRAGDYLEKARAFARKYDVAGSEELLRETEEKINADAGKKEREKKIARFVKKGKRAVRQKRYDDAVPYATEALELSPGHPDAVKLLRDVVKYYIRKGDAQLDKGNAEKAREYNEKIWELFSLYDLEDKTGAWKDFEKNIAKTEKNRDNIRTLLKTAEKHLNNGQLDRAYKACQKVLSADPGNKKVKKVMGKIAGEYLALANGAVGDREKAKEYVKKGLGVDGGHKKLLELKKELGDIKKGPNVDGGHKKLPGNIIRLRSQPRTLSDEDVKKMLAKHNFFDSDWNKSGDFENDFVKSSDGKTVTDRRTGLMWQQSGSDDSMTYKNAQAYVRKLNSRQFAGYSDWRLPTVEKLASLLKSKEVNGLYIDPVFDREQFWCWSSDKRSSGSAWGVNFYSGNVSWDYLEYNFYVRGVRSRQY
ncbi:DUF1566 domain-containing protein [Desulfococcaceae bacterium HSG8]|nr:DUF1566 domain-containing protein [Desulfococcaceae bacterium HSG8]